MKQTFVITWTEVSQRNSLMRITIFNRYTSRGMQLRRFAHIVKIVVYDLYIFC